MSVDVARASMLVALSKIRHDHVGDKDAEEVVQAILDTVEDAVTAERMGVVNVRAQGEWEKCSSTPDSKLLWVGDTPVAHVYHKSDNMWVWRTFSPFHDRRAGESVSCSIAQGQVERYLVAGYVRHKQ